MKKARKLIEIYLMLYLIMIAGSHYQLHIPLVINVSYIIFAALAGIWAAYILIEKKSIYIPEYKTLYILFLAAALTSVVHSLDLPVSLHELYIWGIYLFLYIGILSLVSYGYEKRSLINSAILVGLVYNAYKLKEMILNIDVILDRCKEVGAGVSNPNLMGMMLNLIIILAVGVILQGQNRTDKTISWILVVTGGLLLIATGSRGALIAAPAGILVMMYVYNIRQNSGILGITFVLAGIGAYLAVVGIILLTRPINCPVPNGSWTRGITGRIDMFKYAIYLFQRRPLLGTGLNTYHVFAMPHFNNGNVGINPHNIYLKILSERGIIGFITSVLLVIFIVMDLLVNSRDPGLAAAAIGAIVTVSVHGLADYSLAEPYITRYLIIIVALAQARQPKKVIIAGDECPLLKENKKMNVLYKIVSWVYKILAGAVGKDPIEYLLDVSLNDGVSQEKFNLMLDRLEFS